MGSLISLTNWMSPIFFSCLQNKSAYRMERSVKMDSILRLLWYNDGNLANIESVGNHWWHYDRCHESCRRWLCEGSLSDTGSKPPSRTSLESIEQSIPCRTRWLLCLCWSISNGTSKSQRTSIPSGNLYPCSASWRCPSHCKDSVYLSMIWRPFPSLDTNRVQSWRCIAWTYCSKVRMCLWTASL